MTGPGRTTRAQRLAMPLARNVVKEVAAEHGACQRPVQLRRTDIDTGHIEQVLIPCGHTLASVCPPCAERARLLRAAQCREGWHLDHEPVVDPDPATEDQRALITGRAEAQEVRDLLADDGPRHRPTWTSRSASWTSRSPRPGCAEMSLPPGRAATGLPGAGRTPRPCRGARSARGRSARPTRHPMARPSGPSLFVTLTCPSYGKVDQRRHASRPGCLRLHPGGAGRAALRRAVRPVHPEPPPVRRLRPPVLRRHRTAKTARPARTHRHPRHHLPR